LLPAVQQALDAVRVIANNPVHPGQIDQSVAADGIKQPTARAI